MRRHVKMHIECALFRPACPSRHFWRLDEASKVPTLSGVHSGCRAQASFLEQRDCVPSSIGFGHLGYFTSQISSSAPIFLERYYSSERSLERFGVAICRTHSIPLQVEQVACARGCSGTFDNPSEPSPGFSLGFISIKDCAHVPNAKLGRNLSVDDDKFHTGRDLTYRLVPV